MDYISGFMVTARVLADSFIKMSRAEFDPIHEDILRRGGIFTETDDSAFVATLQESDAVMYAAYANAFIDAYGKLKKTKPSDERFIVALALAETVALWQAVSNFKTMHE